MNMSAEEKEKLAGDLKSKAHKMKDEAENAFEKAKDYFEELKSKGAEALKEHLGDAEKTMSDLFGKKDSTASNPS
jgi:predicted nucleotide-binding protein (sugar kinase/HSP70/actin superfamily)